MRIILNKPRYQYRGNKRRKRQSGGFFFNNAGKGTVNAAFDRLDRSVPGYIDHAINSVIDIPVKKILTGIKKIKGKQSGGRQIRQKGGMTGFITAMEKGADLANFIHAYKRHKKKQKGGNLIKHILPPYVKLLQAMFQ